MTDKNTLKNKYEKYITFDKPVPFWSHSISENNQTDNNCLLFYPVMIKDIFDFYRYCGCLLTDHQSISNMKILSMTCYEYLFYETFDEDGNHPYIYMFSLLLSLCLQKEEFKDILLKENINNFFDMFDKKDSLGKPAFMINNILYDSLDFDNLKDLISFQNDLELPDVDKDKSFRDALELARKRKAKILGNGDKIGDLEDQLICLSLGYGLSYDEIIKISLRKFNKMITYMNKKINYEIYLAASMSGFVTFKEKIEHWMSAINKDDDYSDLLLDAKQVENNILNGKK